MKNCNQPIRLSCIIPTFRRGPVLCATIEMLLAQSSPAYEIIVVDQTPEEDLITRNKLSSWNEDGAITWIRQVTPNASKARNTGALAAQGEALLFLDDDIQIGSDFFSVYQETFARTGATAVVGQVLEDGAQPINELPLRAFDAEIGWLYFRKNYSRECKTSYLISCNFAILRKIFLELGGMDENYHRGAFREETDFALRFKAAGHWLVFQPAARVHHLGTSKAPEGGSRNWIRNKRISGFHHCVGDWYFNLRFARGRLLLPLIAFSIRHFIVNRYNIHHPWLIPILAWRWLGGAPVSIWRRIHGARLLPVVRPKNEGASVRQ